MSLSPVADTTLLARLSREAIPTGEYFRTRTPAGTLPLTPPQQPLASARSATVRAVGSVA